MRAEQASGWWEGLGGAYFTQDDLGGQVLGGPTQGPGAAFHTLGETKVCHLRAQDGRLEISRLAEFIVFMTCST